MNTLKKIVMVCALFGVACSGQYAQNSGSHASGWEGMMAAAPSASSAYGGDLDATNGSGHASYASLTAPAAAAPIKPPTVTQQICSCVAVNGAAAGTSAAGAGASSAAPAVNAAPAYASSSSAFPAAGSQASYSSFAAAAPTQSFSGMTSTGAQQAYGAQSSGAQNSGNKGAYGSASAGAGY